MAHEPHFEPEFKPPPTFCITGERSESESGCLGHTDMQWQPEDHWPVPLCIAALAPENRRVSRSRVGVGEDCRTGSCFASLLCHMMELLNSLWSHSPPVLNFSLHLISTQWYADKCVTPSFIDGGRRERALICNVWWLPWYQYSRHGWCEVPCLMLLNTEKMPTTSSHERAGPSSNTPFIQLSSDSEGLRPQASSSSQAARSQYSKVLE